MLLLQTNEISADQITNCNQFGLPNGATHSPGGPEPSHIFGGGIWHAKRTLKRSDRVSVQAISEAKYISALQQKNTRLFRTECFLLGGESLSALRQAQRPLLHHAAHATHARVHGRSSRLGFLLLGDHAVCGEDHRGDGGGVLEGRAGHLSRVDDASLDEVFVGVGLRVVTEGVLAFLDLRGQRSGQSGGAVLR